MFLSLKCKVCGQNFKGTEYPAAPFIIVPDYDNPNTHEEQMDKQWSFHKTEFYIAVKMYNYNYADQCQSNVK